MIFRVALVSLLIFPQSRAFFFQGAPLALVYSGPGACGPKDGDCVRAAAEVALKAGLRVEFVEPGKIKLNRLQKASVWIQPGGNAIDAALAISKEERKLIRNFVANGGSYLGFCAGAFLADAWADNANTVRGLGIIPVVSYDYASSTKPFMVMLNWQGKRRHVYFQGGGAFSTPKKGDALVVATYPNGAPAVIYSVFGRGKVAISGPHPEAPPEWAESDGLKDLDGSDADLAHQMMTWLLL
ncbi:MAG: BPL-N domain-containing protein [Bdellovibrionales bacterium]